MDHDEANARQHVCVRLDVPCDVDTLLLAVDRFFARGCRACGHAPRVWQPLLAGILSPRENEVFCLLGRGVTCKAIAARLAVSDKTIYTYTARVREKLNLADGAALLQAAIDRTHAPVRGNFTSRRFSACQ